MPPEQARGEQDLDPRSDVWALCVLAYECLVGKPPFQGDNYNALLWAILHDEPVPTTVFQAGDSELWRLLKRGFNKDRSGRWDSARQFGEAIAHWLENQGVLEDICHRSLQASWLPTERPTRPELVIPFDNVALPPAAPVTTGTHHTAQTLIGDSERRPSSHSALVAPQTMPMLRRPKAWSLWLAAAGITAFSMALVFSGAGEDTTEEVGKLTPAEPVAPAAPPPPPSLHRDTPPIGQPESTTDDEPDDKPIHRGSLRKSREAQPKVDDRPTIEVKDLPVLREETERQRRPRRTVQVRKRRPKPSRKRSRPARTRKAESQEAAESNEFDFGI